MHLRSLMTRLQFRHKLSPMPQHLALCQAYQLSPTELGQETTAKNAILPQPLQPAPMHAPTPKKQDCRRTTEGESLRGGLLALAPERLAAAEPGEAAMEAAGLSGSLSMEGSAKEGSAKTGSGDF